MKFEVPIDIPPLKEAEQILVNESVELYEGFIYFHRIAKPTASSVIYSSNHITRLLRENNTYRLILDLTGRELVNHRLRRLMLRQATATISSMKDIVIVLEDNSFQRVVLELFVRTYLRKSNINVVFCLDKGSAINHMRERIRLEVLCTE